MASDHIVDEVRRIRQEQAAKHNFDIHAILAAARRRQDRSGFKVVSFATKRDNAGKSSPRPRSNRVATEG